MQTLTERLLNVAPHDLFSAEDLLQYTSGSDDARYGLVKRAVASAELIRIRRGLYCLSPKLRRKPLNLFAVAQYVYGPSYISLESALSHHGWIPEAVYTVTSASIGESKTFHTPVGTFSYTRIPQEVFYAAVEREGDVAAGGVALVARPIKALADYVYAYRKDWQSLHPVVHDLRVDPQELAAITREELEEARAGYRSKRVLRLLDAVGRELQL